ncbi:MAG: thioredoxin family protein [Gemmatimonadetes bacterium]|nr:MAG: thioredoxin family protein [Gemmatimonadota bacterium]
MFSVSWAQKSKVTEGQPERSVAKIKIDAPAPDFTLTDATGKTYSLSDFKGKYVVLEWVNFGCPFVRKHYDTNNMQQLQKTYTEKGVVWLAICSSAKGKQGYYSGDELTKQLKKEKFAGTAYLIDEDGTVGKLYSAKTTPHMYVIDPDGNLIYMGAIDSMPSAKKEDVKSATNYVAAALDAAMEGMPVETKATKAYGCSVKYGSK